MAKVRIDWDESYPVYFEVKSNDYPFGVEVELTDAELHRFRLTEQRYEEAQQMIGDKVREVKKTAS